MADKHLTDEQAALRIQKRFELSSVGVAEELMKMVAAYEEGRWMPWVGPDSPSPTTLLEAVHELAYKKLVREKVRPGRGGAYLLVKVNLGNLAYSLIW